jgi:phosphatidylglycerophosphatase A
MRPAALLFLATAGGAGFAPVAPGTAGAAVGVVLCLALAGLGPWLYALALLGLLSLGIRAADAAERWYGRKDDGRIVIDEVVGQLIALAPLALPGVGSSWLPVVTGFVAFRVFDIWKPAPARRAERLAGGAGVMFDDVVAGAFAAPAVAGVAWVVGA